MKRILLALSLVLCPSGVMAQEITPDWVRKNTQLFHVTDCTDHETSELGVCYLSQDGENIYMTFVQDNVPVHIRRIIEHVPGVTYEQVWPTTRLGGSEL